LGDKKNSNKDVIPWSKNGSQMNDSYQELSFNQRENSNPKDGNSL
jgi:hypothetical protein